MAKTLTRTVVIRHQEAELRQHSDGALDAAWHTASGQIVVVRIDPAKFARWIKAIVKQETFA